MRIGGKDIKLPEGVKPLEYVGLLESLNGLQSSFPNYLTARSNASTPKQLNKVDGYQESGSKALEKGDLDEAESFFDKAAKIFNRIDGCFFAEEIYSKLASKHMEKGSIDQFLEKKKLI